MSSSVLKKGDVLPSFTLPEASGEPLDTWAFYGRRNLVIVFVSDIGAGEVRKFFDELDPASYEIRAQETEILTIVRKPLPETAEAGRTLGWPGRILADERGEVFRRHNPAEPLGVLVADRFGEIYWEAGGPRQPVPPVDEILSWLRFIQSQCPE